MEMNETAISGLPKWVAPADYERWIAKHPRIDLIEVDSLTAPGTKLEVMICPPDDIAWAMSMKCLSNVQAGANDPVKAQRILAERCTISCQPELVSEMEDEANKIRYQIAIGMAIGELYPMPEAKLKKTFRRQ